MTECVIKRCHEASYAHGMCRQHNENLYRTGHPLGGRIQHAERMAAVFAGTARHWQRWTVDELTVLDEMRKSGRTLKAISNRLGRSVDSISKAISRYLVS